MEWNDRTAVVTGASSGIGYATAHLLASHGATVIAVGRNTAALQRIADSQPGIIPVAVDLTTQTGPEVLLDTLCSHTDRLHTLVNNAGMYTPDSATQFDSERSRLLWETNVQAPCRITNAALPLLEAAPGSVINVTSTYGHRATPTGAMYAATKAAIESLTRSWALELADRRIAVNAIAPGPTDTGVLQRSGLTHEQAARRLDEHAQRIPLGRVGRPNDVATWIVTLASAHWITGQVLSVDGGLSIT